MFIVANETGDIHVLDLKLNLSHDIKTNNIPHLSQCFKIL